MNGDDYEETPTARGGIRTLKATVTALLMKAMIAAFAPARHCQHDDEKGYTVMSGKLIHCKCGQSFKVKCMHIRVQQLLPRVFQCCDCGETRGMGNR